MDKERQIRFLYPPIFLLAWLIWGCYLDPNREYSDIFRAYQKIICSHPQPSQDIDINKTGLGSEAVIKAIGVVAGGGSLILVLGFLISVISITLLRLLFLFCGCQYEFAVSEDCLSRIWSKLGISRGIDRRYEIYAGMTYDHEVLQNKRKNIHKWLARRWGIFYVSTNTCVSLFLAHLLGWYLSVHQTGAWWISTAVTASFFSMHAYFAWQQTMRMIDFQSYRV